MAALAYSASPFKSLGEANLRQILHCYADYYNTIRTHQSPAKDAPGSRAVQPVGDIASQPLLGELHHHYVRI
jgi:hypothetical protein